MKKEMLWIALGALLLPILARGLWFYHGVSARPKIATPDYASLTIPQPPLETPVADGDIKQVGGIVVMDVTHANQFQPSEVESLKEALENRGGKLEFFTDSTLLENQLRYASAYVVLSPSIAFSAGEINLVRTFVDRGGRLIVFTDATRGMVFSDFFTGTTTVYPDTYAVNPLLENFGITVNNDYMYNLAENEGNFRNVFFDEFGRSELTFGLKQVALYGAHSVSSDSGLVLFRGSGSTFSSVSDAHDPAQGGAAMSEDGNVVAFGDFTFLTPPYDIVADNSTLITNIADFLLGGKRTPSLANFPYVFSQRVVQVFPTSDVQMTAEMIAALSSLQTSLRALNISMEIASEKPVDGDVLFLGTFAPSEELDPIIGRFDLVTDDFSETVTIPGFGNVGRAGNGVLLFESGKKGNTLVVLADELEDLISLMDVVSSGSLTSCVLQDQIAVCSVGFGGSFSDGSGASEGFGEGEATSEPTTGEATPTPEPVETPAG